MTSLWQEIRARRDGLPIGPVDAYASLLASTWPSYPGITQTWGDSGKATEGPVVGGGFERLASHAFGASDVVFSVMGVRQYVFSAVRFAWQKLRDGRPSSLFGSADLLLLERPWAGGTTQDLLARMIQDADLAGNSYWVRDERELVRLRPDWVQIALDPRIINGVQVGWRRLGYLYYEGGIQGANRDDPAAFTPDEVAHFAPVPDPLANWRGMSWLTPVIREIDADQKMTRHKARFFDNGATPNMIIKHGPGMTPDKIQQYRAKLDAAHTGAENAYRTLHIGGGADVTVVGKDFRQIDFRGVQGHGETRIAAAGGVPPVLVGLTEGLESATYSNYGQARRRFADGTMHPLWLNAAGSMARIIPVPGRFNEAPGATRLHYDARDVPFLREDEKDAAAIAQTRASTIRIYVDSGFTPESAVAAVEPDDEGLLVHTGLVSVQLLAPGTGASPAADETKAASNGKPPAKVPAAT